VPELVLPEGKLVRTSQGGTDALKATLVDLKRYSFTGYVKTIVAGPGGPSVGCVAVAEGNPELALHATKGKIVEGKVALKSVWQDSYSETCAIEIHAKVDVEAIRARYPDATLERPKRGVRPAAPKATKARAKGEDVVEARLDAWRQAGYIVFPVAEAVRRGGDEAVRAVEAFEAAVAKMEPLRRELADLREPGLLGSAVAALREKAKDPAKADEVAAGLAKVRDQVARLRGPERTSPTELDRERELQGRARQVFEMIVTHRRAEGKPTDISEVQVAKAIEGKPTTRDERTNLIKQYTFDTFVVGPSNRFAHAASVAVAKSPHTAYNPLFITSGPGLGKTHLMNAVGNAILAENAGAKVVYVTAEGFSNEFKEALANNRLGEFREKYRRLDVALLDDAHFLSGKGDVQEELFHTFNDLYTANKQIVLTSDRPPKDIPDLEDRLVSRFESGLIADIQPPEYDTRLAILRRRSRDAGTGVEDDVLDYIARRVEGNIRELGGALNRVVAFSSLMGQPVSLDLAREVLRDLGEPPPREAPAAPPKEIQPGHSYLVEEDRPEQAYAFLGASIRGGGRGLLITRQNPRRVQEKYDIGEARILWLTERESAALETIPPSLERIIHVIEEFMKEGGKGGVMLDGVEYLASSSSFDAVLKFLRRLIDHTSESQFTFLASVSTKTMKEQEIKNLEREMDVLTY